MGNVEAKGELSHGTDNGNSCPNKAQEMCASKGRHQEPRALDWVGFSIDLALEVPNQ